MDYRGEIEYRNEQGNNVTVSWSELCASTTDAINAMHRFAQREHNPRLTADQYRIKKLGIWYKDEDRKHTDRYERIEIPTGPNEVIAKRAKADPHPDFPFVDDKLLNESQKALQAALAEPSTPRP